MKDSDILDLIKKTQEIVRLFKKNSKTELDSKEYEYLENNILHALVQERNKYLFKNVTGI